MISIFRRRRRNPDADGTSANPSGRKRAPQKFSPISCLDGFVWIEDGCVHKSGMDTQQSFRLPLNDVSDIIADWDFYKENPTRAETKVMVQGPMGLIRASFGALQYTGMINLIAHLHHVYTEEETSELGETTAELPEMVGPFQCRRGMMWADRDFVYLGKSVSADSARVPMDTIDSVKAHWDRSIMNNGRRIRLDVFSRLGGLMGSDFSVKQASGVFALVNYVNQLRTDPNR
ncbi:MAG: hypothetical protein OXI54_03980 [Chloroflexota bacterium]|nr:hypothetical protein [Chloroflexota bacterium]